jgi:hypothetical protein
LSSAAFRFCSRACVRAAADAAAEPGAADGADFFLAAFAGEEPSESEPELLLELEALDLALAA